ncbi:MAG: hypothetical protein O6763_06325, partial [Gammaproteobacteria bacterium]|nr:hypothetical protein [Gammaproteobacteria bacterium]
MIAPAATLVLAAIVPAVTWAVCTCGFQDGLFTLSPIVVDGNMSDWAPVHADPDNNVCDGPANGLTDRDAPVQSTGRDLTHFAYTWDATNIYLFTERFGSASNIQSFVYYADTDNDGLMETGEPIIGVTWRGSNRRINIYIYTYVAQAPGGDPVVDGGGFGDGYTFPGSFANVPPTGNPNRTGIWGSIDGLQMEFHVTWAELGLSTGDPFTFHVASSNAALGAASFTAQIDDNLSGCGGGVGSTIIPDVDFTPDRALVGFESQTTTAAHTVTNTGNNDDFFDLSSVVSGAFTPTMTYYHDTDSNGILTGADVLLTDTNGDGNPDTPLLAPAASIDILIAYAVPPGVPDADVATIVTTAASDFQPLATDTVTDVITIALSPDLLVTKQLTTVEDPINNTTNPKAIPGAQILYTLGIANQGPGAVDNDSVVVTDAIAADVCMKVTDLGAAGSGPVAFQDGTPSSNLTYSFVSLANPTDDLEFSNDGGASFTYTPTANAQGCDPAVTHIRILPKGTLPADTGSGSP